MNRRPRKQTDRIRYTDGLCTILSVKDRKVLSVKGTDKPFAERAVGSRRFWDAAIAGVQIVRTLYMPKDTDVAANDVLIIGSDQYTAVQVDLADRVRPVSKLVSLASSAIRYEYGDD